MLTPRLRLIADDNSIFTMFACKNSYIFCQLLRCLKCTMYCSKICANFLAKSIQNIEQSIPNMY